MGCPWGGGRAAPVMTERTRVDLTWANPHHRWFPVHGRDKNRNPAVIDRVAPAWPDQMSVFVYPETKTSYMHDPHKNPYVGWIATNGQNIVLKSHRREDVFRLAEARWTNIIGWRQYRRGRWYAIVKTNTNTELEQ